jgi:peptidoglycan/LPS O-acetylase OafA/YrhL
MSADRRESAPRRLEIEGLRTVAALLVAVFHIWLGRVSGGVDVFFTISGFLITTTLLGHWRRFDTLRPGLYFARLFRRLVPAAVVVIAGTLFMTVLMLRAAVWTQTFEEAVASALFVENWTLAFNAIDYLERDGFHSPVQQFWALSAQGQFYVIWFAVFLLVTAVAGLRRSLRSRLLVVTIAVVAVASFGYALISTTTNQSFAYYDSLARVWEFGLGGLAAIALPFLRPGRILGAVLCWIGLAGVATVGLIVQASTQFPGWPALLPTVGAVLVLIGANTPGGAAEAPRYSAARLLALRPVVWFGGIAFGFYLWHWPIVVVYREVRGRYDVGLIAGLAIIALAVGLAWLTRRLIERPVLSLGASPRRARLGVVIPAVALVAVIAAAVGGLGVLRYQTVQERQILERAEAGEIDCLGAAALDPATDCSAVDPGRPVIPASAPRDDVPAVYTDECRTEKKSDELKECVFGVIGGTRVVVIGNSHTMSWVPAIERIADAESWELHVFFRAVCAFNTAGRVADDPAITTTCDSWNRKLQAELAATEPYVYAFTSHNAKTSGDFLDASGRRSYQAGVEGFANAWSPLIERGTTIYALRDHPGLTDAQMDCAYRDVQRALEDCKQPRRDRVIEPDNQVEAAALTPGVVLIDMTDWFCVDAECPYVIGSVFVYRDKGHLTATYASTLAPFLQEALGLPRPG